jgi:hypothetical protein
MFELGCTVDYLHKLIRRKIRKSLEAVQGERPATPEEADCQPAIYGASADRVTKMPACLGGDVNPTFASPERKVNGFTH